MFETAGPHIFGVQPGADFPAALVGGIRDRLAGRPPEDMARVKVYLNSARMRRAVTDAFTAGGSSFLPQLLLVTEIATHSVHGAPAAVSPLRRQLELSQLVGRLLETQPDLAPRSALYDLTDSLAALMDEMHGEGVSPDAVAALDVSDHSAHWKRTQTFLGIIAQFFDATEAPDAESLQRRAVERLARSWAGKAARRSRPRRRFNRLTGHDGAVHGGRGGPAAGGDRPAGIRLRPSAPGLVIALGRPDSRRSPPVPLPPPSGSA